MGANIPKQFLIINEKPVLFYTIEQFYKFSSEIEIIITLNDKDLEYWQNLIVKYNFSIKHRIVKGGNTRFESVKNAINTIDTPCIVAIHDAVRPFVSVDTISRCFAVAEEKGNAVPFVKITDSIRYVNGIENNSVDRDSFVKIQTPQVFKSKIIKKAYDSEVDTYTDDASVVEAIGEKINLIEGNIENIKITTPFDFKISELIVS